MSALVHFATLAFVSFVVSYATTYVLNRLFPMPRHWTRKL